MIDYEKILVENYKGKAWSFCGNSYDGLVWLDNSAKPTQSELDALWETTQTLLLSKAYIAKRQQAYPSIADQLDLIYHQGLDAWKSAIQAVKDQYPKG